MSLYVDDLNQPYRGDLLSHLVADTHLELLAACDLLGLDPSFIQRQNTPWEYFPVTESEKQAAISKGGAIQVTQREVVELVQRKKRDSRKRGRKPKPIDVSRLNRLLSEGGV